MSRGLGEMQRLILITLQERGGMTVASLHKALLETDRRFKYRFQSDAKDRSRSLRNSLTRALRGLAKAGEAARNDIGEWVATGGEPTGSDRAATAHHEAGHAVIGLAVQLPVAFACITPEGRKGGWRKSGEAGLEVGEQSRTSPKATV